MTNKEKLCKAIDSMEIDVKNGTLSEGMLEVTKLIMKDATPGLKIAFKNLVNKVLK